MKKKIIIAGAVLVVLVGGIGGVKLHSHFKATHTSTSNGYYYNDEADGNADDAAATGTSSTTDENLPSRDEVDTTPDSIYCLVNKEYSLPSDYEPEDLVEPDVSFSIDYESEKKYLRQEASTALESLFKAASEEDLEITAVSGYRSYKRQQEIYENNLKTRGTSHTNQYSAKPGYSEHQTGLVMDVSCKSENYRLEESFGDTDEGKWLAKNCAAYGYVIRYPEDKSEITGYAYEPWHLRYVGIDLATYLTENNLTLDEYYHYEPSFDFITDESEYVNDTETNSNASNYAVASPTPSTPPTTSNGNNSSSNNNNSNSSKPAINSTAPSKDTTTSQAPTTSSDPEYDPPETDDVTEPEPTTETPSSQPASESPSVAPSTQPPSQAPSTTPSTAPVQPDDGSNVDTDDGAAESIGETLQ